MNNVTNFRRANRSCAFRNYLHFDYSISLVEDEELIRRGKQCAVLSCTVAQPQGS